MVDESALHIHQRERHGEPLNAETKAEALIDQVETSTENIFHRNHGDIVKVPRKAEIVEKEWKIAFDIDESVWGQPRDETIQRWRDRTPSNPISITFGDLKKRKGVCEGVESMTLSAAMECAGNRREDLNETQKTEGITWSAGAISNASWRGIGLRSLLRRLGVPDAYGHHGSDELARLSLDEDCMRSDCAEWARSLHLHLLSAQSLGDGEGEGGQDGLYFAASIPLCTAMHPRQDCLLATHQNDEVLTQAHGFPLRAVIPGHIGARWVKWLRGLRISSTENDSPFMQKDYKLLIPPKQVNEEEKERWLHSISGDVTDQKERNEALGHSSPLQVLGIGSAIQKPKEGELISGNTIQVEGYAVGQHGEAISQVEVIIVQQASRDISMKELRSLAAEIPSEQWAKADLRHTGDKESNATWSWSLWSVALQLPSKDTGRLFAIVARAGECS